jgi:hypothetical protein
MKAADPGLERECQVFTRLLGGASATRYVVGKYLEAHRVSGRFEATSRFDRWLLVAVRGGTPVARLADAYARHFVPGSSLRSKMILVLGIMETTPPYHRSMTEVPARLPALVWSGLILHASAGVLSLIAGTAIFGPVQLLARLLGKAP